jgi:N-acetyl-gamma-glutamyl-phosphate reductase
MRWLACHPHAKLKAALSDTFAGQPASNSFPGLSKRVNIAFASRKDPSALEGCDVVFLAGEAGDAMCQAPALLEAGVKVIDLSADFRFRQAEDYKTWYAQPHKSPELTANAVYGLPELNDSSETSLVGNPGCYATASLLALAPLMGGHLDNGPIVIDGKSGVSGAGRSKKDLAYHYAEANESVSAYKVAGTHRHTGEIEQELSRLAAKPTQVAFTPHLIPMTRGLLVTCYGKLARPRATQELLSMYNDYYAGKPFVAVVPHPPATKHTLGSNMCHVTVAADDRTGYVTVIAAIDNLGKGMAGQAIQNMNLMFGLPETAGLEVPPLWP